MNKLETINAEDLQNRTYEPTHFLVDELIPEGLHILAGAPKIGKSWLALWLCLCVAQGQPLWNFAVAQGEVLYLSLEDSFQRIQTRLFDLTEDAPPTLHFAIMADTLKHGLEQQIEQFLTEHPATKLVVIDTLQRVRSAGSDSNLYANDYMPERAKLRQTEDGDVTTVFRDTTTRMEEDCITKQREMLIGGRRFCITSVFPAEPCATPTDKLLACICKEELGLRVTHVNALGGGSEDFSCMSQRVQQRGGQAAYVGLLCACPAANHNDHFDFDEQALANGAAMFTAVTASLLA